MLTKRLVSCLDVRDGKLAKSVKFVDTVDIGDPVVQAEKYYQEGLDELVMYDITASSDRRDIMLDVVSDVACRIFIPFSVGGGLRTVEDCNRVLLAGAEKINVNSAAVLNPELITEASKAFGSQCVVLSMDVRRCEITDSVPSGFEIVIEGGRKPMGLDAIEGAARGEELGVGELVVNSIDADGTTGGYDLELTRRVAETVAVPVIASGGGGTLVHLLEVLTEGKADAALVASMLHYGTYGVEEIKQFLNDNGVRVRMNY